MMDNNIVIYTQRVEVCESYDERRDCSDQRIARFLNICGFLPIPIPNNYCAKEDIIKQLKPCGIVLTGGNSLVKYGGNAPERDKTDDELIRLAIIHSIPLYGFCRGMESVLNYFGNDLEKVNNHVSVTHDISGLEGEDIVNSYHNEGCLKLNNSEFVVVMKSNDGVIEMIRHKNLPIIGTMWHPEREKDIRKKDIEMVKKLFLCNR